MTQQGYQSATVSRRDRHTAAHRYASPRLSLRSYQYSTTSSSYTHGLCGMFIFCTSTATAVICLHTAAILAMAAKIISVAGPVWTGASYSCWQLYLTPYIRVNTPRPCLSTLPDHMPSINPHHLQKDTTSRLHR